MRTTKLFGMAGLALTLSAFGTLAGSAAQSGFTPEPVLASCEDDECENASCIDNPSGNTSCSMEGGGCKTKGCSASIERELGF
jgi:hypothetical protein